MSNITSANRNNIATFLNSRPLVINKQNKSSANQFSSAIEGVESLNAVEEFKTLPGKTSIACNLFHEMATEKLPYSLPSMGLSWQAQGVKDLLGIIYKDAKPEDQDKFDRVFQEFAKTHTQFEHDGGVTGELTYLFSKYAKDALEKHVSDYIQHCREAWSYHHIGHDTSVTDEDIFTLSAMACKEVIDTQIKELTQGKQTWTSLICAGRFLGDACASLSKTLKFHDNNTKSPLDSPVVQETTQHESPSNGQAPIVINNTAYGGNGHSMVNDRPGESHAKSFIDYGIALLNTSDKQLTPEQRTQLSKKFMDLHWGRAQNGGQDKFADHIVDAKFNIEPLQADIRTLTAPVVMQATESFVSLPKIQFAAEYSIPPQPLEVDDDVQKKNVSHGMTTHSPITSDEINVLSKNKFNQNIGAMDRFVPVSMMSIDEVDSALNISNDNGDNLYDAARRLTQSLSKLLNTEGLLSKDSYSSSIQKEQQNEVLNDYVSNLNNVQGGIKTFSRLNVEQGSSIDDSLEKLSPDTVKNLSDDTKPILRSATDELNFQQNLKMMSKNKMITQNKPLYTTNRTIDPFSRHSGTLQPIVNTATPTRDIEAELLAETTGVLYES